MSEGSQSNRTSSIVRVIACRVFKPALEHLRLEDSHPNISLTYLPPNLHLRPQELRKHLRREVAAAEIRDEQVVCLYGDCFPGLGDYCRRRGARKVPGPSCWEMFLGSERFNHLVEEDPGTYFLERELIRNFDEYCIEPLELYDEEMREQCFKHYHRLVYVRQPADPDLVAEAEDLAEFLGLPLEIEDADYSHLDTRLKTTLAELSAMALGVLDQKLEERPETTLIPTRRRRVAYVWLNVQPEDVWLRVAWGDTIRKALREGDVEIGGDCGGLGKCGKCKVKVLSQVDEPTEEERELLDDIDLKEGIRLACRTKVTRDLVISVGEPSAETEYFPVLTTSHAIIGRYIPQSQLEPLVAKRLVTVSPEVRNEEPSDLDRIRRAMGGEFRGLRASLQCLRSLPQKLEESRYHGTAVFHEDCLIDWQNWEEVHRHYGLVFDIGTSTLVGKLISLVDGTEVAVASCLNGQSKYGSDVISRLQYVKERPAGLQTLHYLLMRDLNRLTARLLQTAELEAEDIFIAVVAGNTTMQHVLLKLSPLGIAEAPFSPVVRDALVVKAVEVGLELHTEALLYAMPVRSGYIGGDLISDILTSGVAEQEEVVLGLDLGTNGEIFLGNRERLLTCSAAAGPALEGARISSGTIARAGAIEGVRFEDGQLRYRITGNIRPRGICGSGLVDLIAVLLHTGIISHEGLIRRSRRKSGVELSSRVVKRRAAGHSFLVASPEESYEGRPLYLTQRDVREVQVAKGAIAAGVRILMDTLGIGVGDISRVYLAGALGNYVDPFSAVRIGLLPRMDPEIIKSLGNAASRGASLALLSRRHWQMAKDLVNFIEHVELSCRPDFNEYFVEHLDFPEENIW